MNTEKVAAIDEPTSGFAVRSRTPSSAFLQLRTRRRRPQLQPPIQIGAPPTALPYRLVLSVLDESIAATVPRASFASSAGDVRHEHPRERHISSISDATRSCLHDAGHHPEASTPPG